MRAHESTIEDMNGDRVPSGSIVFVSSDMGHSALWVILNIQRKQTAWLRCDGMVSLTHTGSQRRSWLARAENRP